MLRIVDVSVSELQILHLLRAVEVLQLGVSVRAHDHRHRTILAVVPGICHNERAHVISFLEEIGVARNVLSECEVAEGGQSRRVDANELVIDLVPAW